MIYAFVVAICMHYFNLFFYINMFNSGILGKKKKKKLHYPGFCKEITTNPKVKVCILCECVCLCVCICVYIYTSFFFLLSFMVLHGIEAFIAHSCTVVLFF